MTNADKIGVLILKYADSEPLSPEEQATLDAWRNRSPDHHALPEKFRDSDWVRARLEELLNVPSASIIKRVKERIGID